MKMVDTNEFHGYYGYFAEEYIQREGGRENYKTIISQRKCSACEYMVNGSSLTKLRDISRGFVEIVVLGSV